MDERRDLVDREELRRQINADANGRDDTPCTDREVDEREWRSGWCSGQFHAIELLDAMPAVECPRGWTRGEVLAELDADPDAVCEALNPYADVWAQEERVWVSRWHPEVRRYDVRVVRVAPEPEWVPLTQLVGRTIHGCDCAVAVPPIYDTDGGRWVWSCNGAIHRFPDGTLNLDDATVAVRPEAAT